MAPGRWLQATGNRLATALLRSRLHGVLSPGVLLLEVTGARTGRVYPVPVQYHRQDDGALVVFTRPSRRWWRNLVTHPDAVAWYRGQRLDVRAEVVRDQDRIVALLGPYLEASPASQRAYGVRADDPAALRREAGSLVGLVLRPEPGTGAG